MDCAGCGNANRAAARFCSTCGTQLAFRCPGCGAEHDPKARFCDSCGGALDARDAPLVGTDTETRRVVTLVFADLIGSTTLHERIDAESARRVMAGYYAALSTVVEGHDGTVIKLLGDGVLAGFGVQRAQEDDAVRAVRAAVSMHEAMTELAIEFGELAGELGLRVGINTGEVVVSDDDDDVVGDPVNVAARLQQEARDGVVLIGDATRRLVGDFITLEAAGEFALKGRTGTVAAYRVVSLERPATAPTTSFVGRGDELRRILATQAASALHREAKLAVVVGSPGLGKSRLMDEVGRLLAGEATILTARCEADGGPTFTPIADALRALVSTELEALVAVDEPERDRIINGAVGLCAGGPGPPEETFWVVRRVLGAIGRNRPVVLALDDLHWAEPLLLDLIEHLVEWTTDVPLFVLGAARPELRETRSSLTTAGETVDEVIALDGLDAGAATRLAADAIGAAELPAAVAGRVLAASEGNPLFLGALVRMLVDDGALQWDGDRWAATVELDEIEMPPTIHALLAARIDRLEPSARLVLERASVIGRQFSRGAVMHLLPVELHPELDATLDALRRSELVEPDPAWFLGEPSIRFHHALIRDAAYRRLLKDARADLHATFAEWLEERVGEATDQDETIGGHLEQAYLLLHELGPLDDRARSLGSRAAERLGAEGRRALARDDLTVAAGLLGRAVGVLEAADSQRPELLLDWCEALLAGGDVSAAPSAIDDLGRFADDDRVRAWHTSFVGQLAVLTDPQGLRETAASVAAAADALRALGDAAGEAKAHSVRALALARLGEVGACESALDDALVAARRADDRRRSNAVLAGAPVAALWGPSPVTRASGRCLDVVRVLRITAAAPAVEAVAMRCQAVLEALRGRGEAARRMITASRRTVEDLGLATRILEADMAAGLIELVNDDPSTAERILRPTYRGFRDRGLGVDAAQAGALLGRALLALGRVSEAEAISHECEALAGDDLKAAIAWRGVRAEALARRGEYGDAIEFARDAVALAADTDALLDHADARVALAVALRVAGQHTEADAELAAAYELWSAKGATALLGGPDREGAEPAPRESTASISVVRPNRATANADRMDAAIEARDLDAVAAALAGDFENRYHPLETSGGRDEVLESWRLVFNGAQPTVERADVETLGDNLALLRWRVSMDEVEDAVGTIGSAVMDVLVLIEVDADGRRRWGEVFDSDDLERATARLHDLHAETVGDANLAFAAVRASERRWRDGDWEGVLAVYDRNVYVLDDRRSMMHVRSSGDEFVENLRFLFDGGAFTSTFEAGRGDRLALVRAEYTSNRQDAFSSEHYTVAETDADGRLVGMTVFDLAARDEAFAELEARHRASSSAWAPNLATASVKRLAMAFDEMDWNAIEAELAPEFQDLDRRAHMLHEQDRAQYLAMYRMAADNLTAWATTNEILDTRGDLLALIRRTFRSHGPEIGENESEYLVVIEVNPDGQRIAGVSFGVNERAAADTELDARHRAGSLTWTPNLATGSGERFSLAMNAKDLDAAGSMIAPDFRAISRRRMLQGEMNRDEYLAFMRLVVTMESAAATLEVLATRGDRLALSRLSFWGEDRSIGTSEVEYLGVLEVDHAGRFVLDITFDPDDLDNAYAQLDRLHNAATVSEGTRPVLPSNAASRASDGTFGYFDAQDWSALAASTHPDFVYRDRRNGMHTEFDTQQWIESMQLMAASNARPERQQLSILGDGAMLEWVRWTGTSGDPAAVGTRFEVELLRVVAVDEDGLLTSVDNYDVQDRQAANDELWRLDEQTGEGQQISTLINENRRAFNRHDLKAMRATLSDEFAGDDRRRTGMGAQGIDAYMESLVAFLAQTKDLVSETVYQAAASAWGTLSVARMMGRAHDGGEFEMEFLRLFVTDGHLLTRAEIFELDDLELARTRFEFLVREAEARNGAAIDVPGNAATKAIDRFDELQTESPEDLSNTATRALDRAQLLLDAQDWAALEAMASPDLLFGDRRSQVLVDADRDGWLRSSKFMASANAQERRTVLSTLGDRLTLYRSMWRAEVDGAQIEVETLGLAEVDAEGRFITLGHYDVDDHRHANSDLWRRFCASKPENRSLPVAGDVVAAVNAQDLDAVRALLAEDCTVRDHRALASEPMDRDQYLAYLEALVDETSDYLYETRAILTLAPEGLVELSRLVGHSLDGAAFEKTGHRVTMVRDGRVAVMETFDLEAAEAALARFEELRLVDPGRIPATSATRATDRWEAALVAGDRRAIDDLTAESLVFEDRRALNRTTGDLTAWKRTTEATLASNVRLERTVLSTLGDRLELERHYWAGEVDGAVIDGESLTIREVDASGHFTSVVIFDADDRLAANDELRKRFRASEEGAVLPGVIFDAVRAVNHRDAAGIRATMADDFELVDHRPLGVERMDAAGYLEFVGSLLSETSDSVYETMSALRISPAGAVDMARIHGHTLDGAEYEIVWTQVTVVRDGRLAVMEMFASDGADAAVTRFEELTRPGLKAAGC